jgi:alkanesulfonate monooxygenase SsuD/methylene tetrahydromethanopterin reductase-like flavin-dependent oxidoreductase (luciferase family)
MLRSVARYADAWHTFGSPERIAERGGLLKRYCSEIGRDPSEIRWSVSIASDQAASPERFKRTVETYARLGASEFLVDTVGGPMDDLRRLAETTIPEIRASWTDIL